MGHQTQAATAERHPTAAKKKGGGKGKGKSDIRGNGAAAKIARRSTSSQRRRSTTLLGIQSQGRRMRGAMM